MKRRIWIIVTAVTLATAAIGGVAAFAGGGADEQDTSPSLGIPAPGFDGIDETVVSDGSDLDMGTPVPNFEDEADETAVTQGPTEEGVRGSSLDEEEAARVREGGVVPIGEFPGDEGDVIVGDGPISSPVPAPGFEGLVDEMIVIPSEPDSLVHDVDSR